MTRAKRTRNKMYKKKEKNRKVLVIIQSTELFG